MLFRSELETTRMGDEAALHLDTQIRDALADGTSGIASVSSHIIDKTTATATADRVITIKDLDQAATILGESNAPTFDGGSYIAVVSPRQAFDLRQDSAWRNVSTYSDKEQIYNGEIGKIFNVKVVVAQNTKTFTHHTSATGHYAFVLGRECAGTINLAGGGSPLKPQLIYNDQPDKSDPLKIGRAHV